MKTAKKVRQSRNAGGKKENYNQAKGQKKAKEEEIAPLLNPGQACLHAFKSFGTSMCLLSLIL